MTHDSVQLEWTKPKQGAHNITSYTVHHRLVGDPPVIWSEHNAIVNEEVLLTQLIENREYSFKIRACKCDSGTGSESDISEPIRTKKNSW